MLHRNFKGSGAIGFWSCFMAGLERNTQADDDKGRSATTFRVLKDREPGLALGFTAGLTYDRTTGLLIEGEKADAPKETGPRTASDYGFNREEF